MYNFLLEQNFCGGFSIWLLLSIFWRTTQSKAQLSFPAKLSKSLCADSLTSSLQEVVESKMQLHCTRFAEMAVFEIGKFKTEAEMHRSWNASIHTFISNTYFFPYLSVAGVCWSLSQLSQGEGCRNSCSEGTMPQKARHEVEEPQRWSAYTSTNCVILGKMTMMMFSGGWRGHLPQSDPGQLQLRKSSSFYQCDWKISTWACLVEKCNVNPNLWI